MNIVVLAGGISSERDVSLVTGTEVTKALRKKGHKVIMTDVFLGVEAGRDEIDNCFENSEKLSTDAGMIKETAPDINAVKAMRKDSDDGFFGPNVLTLCKKADIVFLALHGENGENGRLQAALDLYGIKYTGSGYIESAMAMHKSIAKIQMLAGGVNVPDGFVLKKGEAVRIPGFPCIVKPNSGGSSIGVSIANDEAEYSKALEAAFEWEDTVLVEDYIKGREFSVCVIDHKALPVIEIAPLQGFYDYKNKYKAGSAIETCPAEITKEQTENMQEQAEKAAKALKLNTYSRMDFIMREDGKCYCLEANTLPGMTPTSLIPQEARAVGVSFEDLCEKIINISLKKYEG